MPLVLGKSGPCKAAALGIFSRPLQFLVVRLSHAIRVIDYLMLVVRFPLSYVLLQPVVFVGIYNLNFAEGMIRTRDGCHCKCGMGQQENLLYHCFLLKHIGQNTLTYNDMVLVLGNSWLISIVLPNNSVLCV